MAASLLCHVVLVCALVVASTSGCSDTAYASSEDRAVLMCYDGDSLQTCSKIQPSAIPSDAIVITSSNSDIDELMNNCNKDAPNVRKKRKVSLIYKGTNYCGMGDDADKKGTLGPLRKTDTCCKEHDLDCKYPTVKLLWSRLHCDCDATFHACLKRVISSSSTSAKDRKAAKTVGDLYFNKLAQICFKYKTIKKRKHVGFWKRKYKYSLVKKRVWKFVKKFP